MGNRRRINSKLDRMRRALPGSWLRVSDRGVPHLAVRRALRTFSVCYFASSDTWRVFWPWPTYGRRQFKRTFHADGAVVKFLEGAVG